MSKENPNYKVFLNDHGIKSTKQRNLLLTILHETGSLLTAEALYLRAKKLDDSISLSTIYRILELFNKKNIIQRTTLHEDDKAVFELNDVVHRHHLICLGCNKIIDIDQCPLSSFERDIEANTEFSIVNHKLEVYGYCKDCRKNTVKKL